MLFSPFHRIPFCAFPRQSIILEVVCNLLYEADILPWMYAEFLSTHRQHIHFPLVIIFTFLCLLDDLCLRQASLVGWTSGDTTLAYRVLLCDSSLPNSPVLLQSYFRRKDNTLEKNIFFSVSCQVNKVRWLVNISGRHFKLIIGSRDLFINIKIWKYQIRKYKANLMFKASI